MPRDNSDFRFEIVETIAVLSSDKNGWTKELNLISYNDNPPKYDLRSWDPNHEKMGKGITLSKEEMKELIDSVSNLEL